MPSRPKPPLRGRRPSMLPCRWPPFPHMARGRSCDSVPLSPGAETRSDEPQSDLQYPMHISSHLCPFSALVLSWWRRVSMRATIVETNCSFLTAAITAAGVGAVTLPSPLIARDAVATETPASLATSLHVAMPLAPFPSYGAGPLRRLRSSFAGRGNGDTVTGYNGEMQGHLPIVRSEEHTSELQSLMRISYAVFCLKKK